MLVVTIIIAAVVSGFAGGLIGSATKKAPTLSMDVKIVNSGDWHGSGFFATVTSVSEPIPTKDLRIVTSWTKTSRNSTSYMPTKETGGNTVIPGTLNINTLFNPSVASLGVAPFGTGPGVNGSQSFGSSRGHSLSGQQFGNYTLMQGTTLTAIPAGAADADSIGSSAASNGYGGYGAANASWTVNSPGTSTTYYFWDDSTTMWTSDCSPPVMTDYSIRDGMYGFMLTDCYCGSGDAGYANCVANADGDTVVSNTITTPGSSTQEGGSSATKFQYTNCGNSCIDPTKAVLGNNWNDLMWGDSVNVKVIYIPTGAVIFQQDVPVTEG